MVTHSWRSSGTEVCGIHGAALSLVFFKCVQVRLKGARAAAEETHTELASGAEATE